MLRQLSHFSPGLAIGDVPDKQPIGIVLTVLGVVVLDFCADATEGPIRAYLLDVVDSEEQDMALNIHAFSAGMELAEMFLAAVQSSWRPNCGWIDYSWAHFSLFSVPQVLEEQLVIC